VYYIHYIIVCAYTQKHNPSGQITILKIPDWFIILTVMEKSLKGKKQSFEK